MMKNDNNDNDNDNDNDNEHPLINKYKLTTNNDIVECNICYEDTTINIYKCNKCIFQMCVCCYNKYNKNTCPMCRL